MAERVQLGASLWALWHCGDGHGGDFDVADFRLLSFRNVILRVQMTWQVGSLVSTVLT